jgi:hypothetical protein
MTSATADIQCILTIPRHLTACFGTPADVKTYLIQQRVWPEGVQQERWRMDVVGYIVELEVSVPLPPGAGGIP